MDENSVLSLLESISSSESLRKKFLDALRNPVQQDEDREGQQRGDQARDQSGNTVASPPVVEDHPPDYGEDQLTAGVRQSGINASLGAGVPQLRGVSGLDAGVRQSSASSLGDGDSQAISNDGNSSGGSTLFDPNNLKSDDDFTFETHEVIKQYLEKHFRASLDKDVRKEMHKEHPVPRTPAMKVPKVDRFVLDHLNKRFPRSRDAELGTIQAALLRCAGPLSCLWSELIDNDLLKDEDSMINVHDALSVVQRTLVLLGNANELVSQTRRCNILRSVDQGLEKYGKEPPTNSEEFLFGKEFCPKLKATVESDKTLAQVVQISHRYQPYDQKSRQSTLGHSKKQFFRPGPAGNSGSWQSNVPPSNKQPYKPYHQYPHPQKQSTFQAHKHSGRLEKS